MNPRVLFTAPLGDSINQTPPVAPLTGGTPLPVAYTSNTTVFWGSYTLTMDTSAADSKGVVTLNQYVSSNPGSVNVMTDTSDPNGANNTFNFTPPVCPVCGNGKTEGTEKCDDGYTKNGTVDSCCTETCTLKLANTVCTDDGNICTKDICNGLVSACTHPAAAAGTVCREAASAACDIAETCTGTTCPADVVKPSATVCRAAVAGGCDIAETCNGSNTCPGDTVAAYGTQCRASGGACDPAETCNGSNACPANVISPNGTVCRASAGACDPQEVCNGSAATCPADAKSPTTTVCRAAAGACDPEEKCPGSTSATPNDCPANVLSPTTTICRPVVNPGPYSCDIADYCLGDNPACPGDNVEWMGKPCRVSAGACDPEEKCTGTTNTCPTNALSPSGTVCRPAVDLCDADEICNGSTAACPTTDAKKPSSFVCRPLAGVCDKAENCTGTTNACPADTKLPANTSCTDDGNACTKDQCDGTNDACMHPVGNAGTACGPAADLCHVRNTCSGSSADCPTAPLAVKPDGTPCNTGNETNRTCREGQCVFPAVYAPSLSCSCLPGTTTYKCTVSAVVSNANALAVNPHVEFIPPTGDTVIADPPVGPMLSTVPLPLPAIPVFSVTDAKVIWGKTSSSSAPTQSLNGNTMAPVYVTQHQTAPATVKATAISDTSPLSTATVTIPLCTICGNGVKEGTEKCDQGTGINGSADSCCAADCTFKTNGTACTDDGNPCSTDKCNGTNEFCQHAAGNANTDCRVAVGGVGGASTCDVTEKCTGSSTVCPPDAFVTAASNTTCRAAVAGGCDVLEKCSGTGPLCPPDVVVAAGTQCRGSAGVCDAVESCNGISNSCPGDSFLSAGTACTADTNVCTQDICSGSSAACTHPAVAAGTECRAAAGDCDLPEICNGTACPGDARKANGVSCPDDGNVCTTDLCNGTSNSCQHAAGNTGVTCRASGGACDPAETCNGTATCPANVLTPANTVCRPSAGDCDSVEKCDGVLAACPANAFQPSTYICRAAPTSCDIAESCPGTGPQCPGDARREDGFACTVPPTTPGICRGGTCDGSTYSALLDCSTCAPGGYKCTVTVKVLNTNPTAMNPRVRLEFPPNDSVDSQSIAALMFGNGPLTIPVSQVRSISAFEPVSYIVWYGTPAPIVTSGDPSLSYTTTFFVHQYAPPSSPITLTVSSDTGFPSTVTKTFATKTCSLCGDGTVQSATEQCDEGSANGTNGSCCTANCQRKSAGTLCRESAGECDIAESCTGTSEKCPNDVKAPAETACPNDGNACTRDVCDGTSILCTHPAGNAGAICNASHGDCDPAEQCTGTSTTCPRDRLTPAGTECRAEVAGVDGAKSCDIAEECDGEHPTCPDDSFLSTHTECRVSVSECDLTESCPGNGALCPADAKKADLTDCTGGKCFGGMCDNSWYRIGENNEDNFRCDCDPARPGGYLCELKITVFTATGKSPRVAFFPVPGDVVHDPANVGPFTETAPVTSTSSIPLLMSQTSTAQAVWFNESSSALTRNVAHHFQKNIYVEQRMAASAEVTLQISSDTGYPLTVRKTFPSPSCPLPVCGNHITEHGEECDDGVNNGTLNSCCSETCHFEEADTVCADDGNVCTIDYCDGESAICQHDAANAGAVCRASAGACDPAEKCSGTSEICPKDKIEPQGIECRPAVAGVGGVKSCDKAESCDGENPGCPANAFVPRPPDTTCRPSVGECDIADICPGDAAICPVDAWKPNNVICDGGGGLCRNGLCIPQADIAVTSLTCNCGVEAGTYLCDFKVDVLNDNGEAVDPVVIFTPPAGDSVVVNPPIGPLIGASPIPAQPANVIPGMPITSVSWRGDATLTEDAHHPVVGIVKVAQHVAPMPVTLTVTSDTEDPNGGNNNGVNVLTGLPVFSPVCTWCGNHVTEPNVGEQCDEGVDNGGAGSCCTANCQLKIVNTLCRASIGECDLPEVCTGQSGACPANLLQPPNAFCTDDANPCTVDRCDGTSVLCQHPVGNGGVTCRAAAGNCDLPELCPGNSAVCPPNVFRTPTDNACRPAVGECDRAEFCPGNDPACPGNTFQPSTVACTGGTCDGAGMCVPTNPFCGDTVCNGTETCDTCPGDCGVCACKTINDVCSATRPCCAALECVPPSGDNRRCLPICGNGNLDGVEQCDQGAAVNGTAGSCCTTSCTFKAGGEANICRNAAGVCDRIEYCSGTSGSCPADDKIRNGTLCTDDQNLCTQDICDGNSVMCTHPVVTDTATVCRASTNATCDPVEFCNGQTTVCPLDVNHCADPCLNQPATHVCRASTGPCDAPELCDGVAAHTLCPPDVLYPVGTTCHASVNSCDIAESCDGQTVGCPNDVFLPDGTACTEVTNGSCLSHVCTAPPTGCLLIKKKTIDSNGNLLPPSTPFTFRLKRNGVPTSITAPSNAGGLALFQTVPLGLYTVTEDALSGWTPSGTTSYDITVTQQTSCTQESAQFINVKDNGTPTFDVSITVDRSVAGPGDMLNYTITVRNTSSFAAPATITASITDPSLLTGITALDGGSYSASQFTWPTGSPLSPQVGSVPGETRTVHFKGAAALATAVTNGVLTATAHVGAYNPAATVSIVRPGTPSLTISNAVSTSVIQYPQGTATPQTATFTVTVTNAAGSATANGVAVSLALPPQFTVDSGGASWTITSLPASQSDSHTVTVHLNPAYLPLLTAGTTVPVIATGPGGISATANIQVTAPQLQTGCISVHTDLKAWNADTIIPWNGLVATGRQPRFQFILDSSTAQPNGIQRVSVDDQGNAFFPGIPVGSHTVKQKMTESADAERWNLPDIVPAGGNVTVTTGACRQMTFTNKEKQPAPGLAITQSLSQATVYAGDPFTVTVTVSNLATAAVPSPVTVNGAVIKVTLPAQFTITDNGGGVTAGQSITWTQDAINAGATVTKTVRVTAPNPMPAGPFASVATAQAVSVNSITHTLPIPIGLQPTYTITISDGLATAAPSTILNYAVTVINTSNISPTMPIDVTVHLPGPTASLPSPVQFLSTFPSQGEFHADPLNTVTWHLLSFPAHATVVLPLSVRITPSAPNATSIAATATIATYTNSDNTVVVIPPANPVTGCLKIRVQAFPVGAVQPLSSSLPPFSFRIDGNDPAVQTPPSGIWTEQRPVGSRSVTAIPPVPVNSLVWSVVSILPSSVANVVPAPGACAEVVVRYQQSQVTAPPPPPSGCVILDGICMGWLGETIANCNECHPTPPACLLATADCILPPDDGSASPAGTAQCCSGLYCKPCTGSPNCNGSGKCAPLCGDGTIQTTNSEECDQGTANGTDSSCCKADCKLRAQGFECRASAGNCDSAEVCDGSAGSCPGDLKDAVSPHTVCHAATGECDQAESCDGFTNTCAEDHVKPDGTFCSIGLCKEGECMCSGNGESCTAETGCCEAFACVIVQGSPTAVNTVGTCRPIPPTCGNGVCEAGTESCDICPADCACPPVPGRDYWCSNHITSTPATCEIYAPATHSYQSLVTGTAYSALHYTLDECSVACIDAQYLGTCYVPNGILGHGECVENTTAESCSDNTFLLNGHSSNLGAGTDCQHLCRDNDEYPCDP